MSLVGQLAATTPTEIIPTRAAGGEPRVLTLFFYNAHASSDQVVEITLTRAAGTEYTIFKETLKIKEKLVVANLRLKDDDQIKAAATNATSVNYVIFPGVFDGMLDSYSLDSTGARKGTTTAAAQVFSGNVSLLDSVKLMFGTGDDITATWNGTDLIFAQAAADSVIKWGESGAGINHVFYGDTAGRDLQWDQTNDQLLALDNTKLSVGTGAGGVGDISWSWDGTRCNVTQLTANSEIRWGVDGAGIDQIWYGDTASTNVTWDQSADSMIFNGATRIVWTGTTGQAEMHLTDNLADALSIEISGSTDLLTFCTTDDAESVSPIGLRTRSSTAVAITGVTTLKLSDSGGIFTVSQGAAYDIDLPSPTSGPGCSYFFSVTAPGANNVTITVAGGAATFVGSLITEGQIIVATGSTLTIASGVAVLGDSIEVRSIATNLYHVRAVSSILNGITVA